MNKKKGLNRRKFFNIAGFAAVGAFLMSKTPLRFFDKSKRIRVQKGVRIHPSAVKRTK